MIWGGIYPYFWVDTHFHESMNCGRLFSCHGLVGFENLSPPEVRSEDSDENVRSLTGRNPWVAGCEASR